MINLTREELQNEAILLKNVMEHTVMCNLLKHNLTYNNDNICDLVNQSRNIYINYEKLIYNYIFSNTEYDIDRWINIKTIILNFIDKTNEDTCTEY